MRKGTRPGNAEENPEIFALHAEFCKVIANPTRLMLISRLRNGELTVGELARGTGASLANISQHLRILRDHDIVRTRKEGRSVHYRLRDARLVEVCELTHAILLGGIQQRSALVGGAPVKRAVT
ncbi:MAG: ArsR/SmtB family transcription factor [Bryobacteraceae bacterium]